MNPADLTAQVETLVRDTLAGEGSGHDWWHIARVRACALRLCREEGGDPLVVELTALLHDIADWKFHHGDLEAGPRRSAEVLAQLGAPPELASAVVENVRRISFKGARVPDAADMTLEGQIVQDADRLDAIGAVGIARAFAYGGSAGRLLHDPGYTPLLAETPQAYRASGAPTIAHFYEKLLLLKERMHTSAARRLAEGRHAYMEQFLARFYAEWDGEA